MWKWLLVTVTISSPNTDVPAVFKDGGLNPQPSFYAKRHLICSQNEVMAVTVS